MGPIPPETISGGTKALLLMEFDDSRIYDASNCGDNCAKWILDIGDRKDLTINLGHVMNFPEPFEMFILNSSRVVKTMYEFLLECCKYL